MYGSEFKHMWMVMYKYVLLGFCLFMEDKFIIKKIGLSHAICIIHCSFENIYIQLLSILVN